MSDELLYQIALTMVRQVGDVYSRILVNACGSASAVFRSSIKQLEKIEGIGAFKARQIKAFNDFESCEKEISFIEKFRISPLFFTEPVYPQRLLNCYDAPPLLYFKGNSNLNYRKIISIVGTRNNTDYGRLCCEKLIEGLKTEDVLIVSGLAFGIDTIAHKNSLKQNLNTIAVVAHGLDRIYPAENKMLAKLITENGGLLTDFRMNTKPDKQNFPRRNRIVAGICDALIVIESGSKGGSMITAELANSYNKDVFAFPGRGTDPKSEGCNTLIRLNKAALSTSVTDITETLGWVSSSAGSKSKQISLFTDLTPAEKTITDILLQSGTIQIDELFLRSKLSSSTMAASLLNLEMQGIIIGLPGKIYKLS